MVADPDPVKSVYTGSGSYRSDLVFTHFKHKKGSFSYFRQINNYGENLRQDHFCGNSNVMLIFRENIIYTSECTKLYDVM